MLKNESLLNKINNKLNMCRTTQLGALALVGLGLVGGAFVLEYGFGAKPCHLCWLQRYGHWALLGAAGLGVLWRTPRVQAVLLLVCVVTMVYGFGLGSYHVLVQAKLIAGPQGCTGGLVLPLDAAGLLSALKEAQPPRCDEVNFTLFGLSLAAWNVLTMALLLAVAWVKFLPLHKKV